MLMLNETIDIAADLILDKEPQFPIRPEEIVPIHYSRDSFSF